MKRLRNTVVAAAFAAFGLLPVYAQEIPIEGPAPTTALINAESKSHAQLNPAMLRLEVNGRETPIQSVTPVRPGNAQIAILIDEGMRTSFNLQLQDFKNFINGLPPGAQVLIGYMQNGTVRSSGHFTADHNEALDTLRVPFGAPGASASPYFCLSDFVKHWPSSQPGPRFVLMITNGVDPYNGRPSVLNQDSPYVETAQNDAQRAGVAVYSIYYGLRGERGPGVAFSGQNYLQQVADATGGQLLYNGTITPPSLAPFLNQFRRAIAESYTIGFMASTNHENRNTLTHIKLRTSQPGIRLHVPDGVHPGVAE